MAQARVHPILTTELDEALVLARLGREGLDPDRWRLDILDLMRDRSGGGVLVARDARGRLCGLLTYRIVPTGEDKPSLEVERLTAFDLVDPRPVADALVAHAIREAKLQDCDSLRLVRPLDAPAEAIALVLASGVGDLHSVF